MTQALFYNIGSLVRVEDQGRGKKSGRMMQEACEIRGAYLVTHGEKIESLGPMKDCPSPNGFDESVDCSGRIVLPGFVDSHTHVLYAGDRAEEFEMRSRGMTYEEIVKAGGGIKRSVEQVRNASEEELVAATYPRLHEMIAHGTTTVEIKSGYGLSLQEELKMLRAIRRLKGEVPIEIHATFMGAHDIPTGVPRENYLNLLVDEMIPAVARERLAEFCDVFCDRGYFTPEETRKIGVVAKEHGMKLKIHANELGETGGAEVAVELGALSADHMIHLGEGQFRVLKGGKTIVTLLPGTSFFLKFPYAPARKLIDNGIAVALATDSNPGSCTTLSIPFILNLATTQMGMTPAEALVATTLNGAAALGIAGRIGSLEVGKEADLIVTKPMTHLREIPYRLAQNPCWRIYKGGNLVAENPSGLA